MPEPKSGKRRFRNPWAAAARRAHLKELQRLERAETDARANVRVAPPEPVDSDGGEVDPIFAELVDRDASERAADPVDLPLLTPTTPPIPAPPGIPASIRTPSEPVPVHERPWLTEPVDSPVDPDDAVAEGLLLAENAVIMGLKNRLIVQTLGQDFADVDHLGDARLELVAAADELERSADIAQREYVGAIQRPGKAPTPHAYRRRDAGNLRLREQVGLRMADILRDLGDNTAYLASLVDRARHDAWREIGDAILDRMQRREAGDPSFDGAPTEADALAAADREARIGGVHSDLAALADRRAREHDPGPATTNRAAEAIADSQDPYGAF